MRTTTIFASLVFFILIVVGFTQILNQNSADYGVSINTSELEGFNKVEETYDVGVEIGDTLEGSDDNIIQEGINTVDATAKGVSALYTTMKLIPEMISNIARILGIPLWVFYLGMTVVVITIVISIATLILTSLSGGGK